LEIKMSKKNWRTSIVHMKKKPEDFHIPSDSDLADRLKFNNIDNLLIFKGLITRKDKEKAKGFSRDPEYHEAINNLYRQSRKVENNPALVYISIFRWFLVLLSALIITTISSRIYLRNPILLIPPIVEKHTRQHSRLGIYSRYFPVYYNASFINAQFFMHY